MSTVIDSPVLIVRCIVIPILLTASLAQADPPNAAGAKPNLPATPAKPPAAGPELSGTESLLLEEQQIGDRYKRLEEVLLRMAELTAATDPRRAALLKKAVAQGKEQLIGVQFEQLVKVLEKGELSRAIDNQTELDKDLRALLQLLLSENRAKRLESEKARIHRYLKELSRLIADQKSLQGRTASAGEPKNLSPEQLKLAERTASLAKEIKDNEEPGEKSASGKRDDKKEQPKADRGKPGPAKPGDKAAPGGQKSPPEKGASPAPGKSAQGKPGSPAKKGQSGQPGQSGKPGQPGQQGSPSPQNPGQDQPEAEENPARNRLEQAEKAMREAEQKLAEARKNDAAGKQDEAIRELQRAKAALEEILRQLRQEEKERTLALLEARFTKMLRMQRDVFEGTVRLDKVPEKDRSHNHEIEAGRLSGKEAEIVVEADKATLLLHDDGTAVAFPEALRQMRQDMQQIVGRLAEAKVGKITQGVEKDVIAALEEMLDALKKAQKDLEDRKQRGQSAGEPQSPALVDTLAELKMIRALQVRVNGRTERYSKLAEGEQAAAPDLIEALKRLAEDQQRIYKITRDMELGKNR